jgi:hypothetical protein
VTSSRLVDGSERDAERRAASGCAATARLQPVPAVALRAGPTPGVRRRRIIRLGWIPLLCAVLLVACSHEDDPLGPDAATVEIEQYVAAGDVTYVEGSYSYVAVTAADGDDVLERRLPDANPTRTTVRLDPGRYRLESWQRPCDGDCSRLGPPADRCARDFELRPRTPLLLRIDVRPSRGCDIVVAGGGG